LFNNNQKMELQKRISQWQDLVKKYSFLENMISDKFKQILLGGTTKNIQTVEELIAAANNLSILRQNDNSLATFGVTSKGVEEVSLILTYTPQEIQQFSINLEKLRVAAQALLNQRLFLNKINNAEQLLFVTNEITFVDGNIDFLNLFNPQNTPPSYVQIIMQYALLKYDHNIAYPSVWDNEIKPRWDSLDTTQADINLVITWQARITQMVNLMAQSQKIVNFINHNWTDMQKGFNDKITVLQAALIRANEKRTDLVQNPVEPETENPTGRKQPILTDLSNLPLTAQGINEANAISFNDVRQGNIDDCPVISSLAGLAANNPKLLLQMLDGRDRFTLTSTQGQLAVYNVIVFCRNPQTVILEERTVSVTANFYTNSQGNPVYAKNGAKPTELWAMLYEKALAQLRGGYDGLNYSSPQEMAAMLTGKESIQTKLDSQTDAQIIALLQVQRNITIISSRPNAQQTGQANNFAVPLVNDHAYRFVGLNNDLLNLNNPQGQNHINNMTIKNLRIYFNIITTN
jgi:Calpain family cysteine protease